MFEEFMGTMPVSERQKFDTGALRAYMQQHIGPIKGELAVEQFKGGQSNPTFKLSADGQSYVLRTKPGPAAKLLASAHAIDREFRVMDALSKAGFPAAKQYALCTDEAVIGRAFYLMEFVDGRVLWDQSLPGMSNAQRAAIYDEMNRVIAQLHTIDYAAIGLADFGKPGNYFARQIDRWTKQYKASETEKIEAMDQLIAWLPRQYPGRRRDLHRAWRLPPRQHDLPPDRAAHPGGAGLGVVDARPSARRFFLPLHELAHPARASSAASAASTWRRSGIPSEDEYIARYCRTHRQARSARRTSASTWPTTCSAWPASCKAS